MKDLVIILTSLSVLGIVISVSHSTKKPSSFSPKKNKRYIELCPMDGNCLFTAIGSAVGKKHSTVRRSIVREMWKNKSNYEPFFTPSGLNTENKNIDNIDKIDPTYSSYLNRMLEKGQWGGEMEIVAASNLYKRPVIVFSNNYAPKYFNETKYKTKPIEIFYNGSNHYDSVLEK